MRHSFTAEVTGRSPAELEIKALDQARGLYGRDWNLEITSCDAERKSEEHPLRDGQVVRPMFSGMVRITAIPPRKRRRRVAR